MRVLSVYIGLSVFLASSSMPVFAADLPAGHPPIDQSQQQPVANHSGEVTEATPAAEYIYLHVKGSDGEEWLATMKSDIKPGTKIKWNDGFVMRNFNSKTLNRTFESVRFVEVAEPAK